MLDAITKSSEKITVYYQNGQIKAPKKYYHLMAYWEKGMEPITMPNHISSFHPKVWVIRYESKENPPKYRVLITSRNLTFARDWDIAFSTDGNVTEAEQPKNKALVHFLQFLNNKGKRKLPNSFLIDLLKVKFEISGMFESMSFHPIGIQNPDSNKLYINPIIPKMNWEELLIVSPFADNTTLDSLRKITYRQPFLLCRKEELDGIKEDVLNGFNCWQFSKFIQEAEHIQTLEEEGIIPLDQKLHAKLFIGMVEKTPYWYLGSANCTNPAQQINIEFLVLLKWKIR